MVRFGLRRMTHLQLSDALITAIARLVDNGQLDVKREPFALPPQRSELLTLWRIRMYFHAGVDAGSDALHAAGVLTAGGVGRVQSRAVLG